MNIMLEGIDNSGKSTLASMLSQAIYMPILKGTRMPTFELTLEKIRSYLGIENVIMDRHPIISEMIYGRLRDHPPISSHLLTGFNLQTKIVVYCRCVGKGMEGHLPSPSDTPDHLEAVQKRYDELLAAYDEWALRGAHIIYHEYWQAELVIHFIKGAVDEYRRCQNRCNPD